MNLWHVLILASLMIVALPAEADDGAQVPVPTEQGPCNVAQVYSTEVPPHAELHEECIWQLV